MPRIYITGCSAQGAWYRQDIGKSLQFDAEDSTSYHTPLGRIPKRDAKLLYTKAEYEEIVRQRDKMIDDLERHAQTIVDMQDELSTAREKVELPKDVAEAIEFLRQSHFSDFGIIALSDQTSMLGEAYSAMTIERLEKIDSYPLEHKILKALVNGYTVEQTPEDQLLEKIEELIKQWYDAPETDDRYDFDIHELAGRIVEKAKQLQT